MTKRERIAAHVEHLQRAFPTPYPVTVLMVGGGRMPENHDGTLRGITHRKGRGIFVLLNMAFPRWSVHDTLNHEWAHALDWRPESVERMRLAVPDAAVFLRENRKAVEQYLHEQIHDDHFYLDLGRVERAWESWEV